MDKPRKQYPSGAQKARLVSLLEADASLRSGKFTASFSKKIAESRWRAIATELNAMGGAVKEWLEWRKCWQDMKSKRKKKASTIRRTHEATGGGPSMVPLAPIEEVVLNTISNVSMLGHADSSESAVAFKDLNLIDGDKAPAATGFYEIEVIQEDVDLTEELCGEEEKETTRLKKAEKAAEDYIYNILKEKLALKKKFYEDYISEMRRQTDALLKIAENIKNLKD